MITDSYSKMVSDVSMRSMMKESGDREKELSMYRSGSAPPTVEGSLSAVGALSGFASDEELRADPAYVSYYYSNVKLNPRLPPPSLSKEDWRFSQRVHGGGSVVGGIGDRRRGNGSAFSVQGVCGGREENGVEVKRGTEEWGGDGLIGLPGPGLGRQKSIAEIFKDDMSQHPSRPASRNAFDDGVESSESQFAHLLEDVSASQSIGAPASHSYASALGGSLSRSGTPDPQLLARAPSPRNLPVGGGRTSALNQRSINGFNSYESAELGAAFSGLNLSTNGVVDGKNHSLSQLQHVKQHQYNSHYSDMSASNGGGNSPSHYNNANNSSILNYGLNGYTINPTSPPMMGQVGSGHLPPLYENVAAASAMGMNGLDSRALAGGLSLGMNLMAATTELQNLSRTGNQVPLMDTRYLQYLRSQEYAAAHLGALNDPSLEREGMGNSYMDLLGLQKAYLGQMLSSQKSQHGAPYLSKSGGLNHGYYGNPGLALGMSYPGGPYGSGSPTRNGEQNMRFAAGMRNVGGGVMGAWHSEVGGNLDSLLDEFKSSKTKCFELSEISGHVVEFSADQYGSRFIQQKLETASIEEKNMVFHEIMPQALSLMTDVFGNYVIQKFFEHGSASQIRELADQLTGHVLTLSLQMYGCRVIQKAIEVVDLDQQTKMVTELDGHIMRCVRDQNGNHVIQKCIECIPEDAIHFIVSTFYDHVVTLSTHPYGCRVIQRVLEHCRDPKTQSIVMEAVLQSVDMLAQDQYGNYVVQHVLEHGKQEERSTIIKKLSTQIVQMSQQKFASNVVEKCLCFGTPTERQILVTEMLGTTDENEPLQAMMKDQYANYVVQKVLETCDEQQLELILNRIKVHLNALNKYTYGKHIVARVEKLVAAGERRISFQTNTPHGHQHPPA